MVNNADATKTLQQERAESAWSAVEEVVKKPFKKEYGSLVRGLPAMIQTNGLGPTLAFLQAKAKGKPATHYGLLFDHVSRWVLGLFRRVEHDLPEHDLLEWVYRRSSVEYRDATTEAIAYSIWLKRLAEAKGWAEE